MIFGEKLEKQYINVAENVNIAICIKGDGPPLLLLHGYPQTGFIWHKIAPLLAKDFTVVVADLRGYGDSDKPPTSADHAVYSKRAMAADMIAVMAALGHQQFFVVGHDRGGRVAHRLARDHPQAVKKLAVLDIAPTAMMYDTTDMQFATSYYHWFFLIQPAPFPETLIGHDPKFFLESKMRHWGKDRSAITDDAFDDYLRCFSNPDTIHASCEDYRASASIDLEHDAADVGQMLDMPLLVLWGATAMVGNKYDMLAAWREVAVDVSGFSVPGGHYLPEESPDETYEALLNFFTT
jgi:haloacetate dehalogenase